MKKITFFLLKVEDTGLESGIDGIDKLSPSEIEELGVQHCHHIDAETLKIYFESNPNIPVGCSLSLQLITEQLET